MAPLSPFPPDFAGNPWSYGFALFGTALMASLSLAQILSYALEGSRLRHINAVIHNPLPRPRLTGATTLSVHRWILTGLLLAIFLRTSTDAIVLLTWGEIGAPAMTAIFLANYIANGVATIPFVGAMLLWCWAFQSIPQQLAKAADVPMPHISWRLMRDKMKIAGVVLVIAVGVTLGKAGVA